MTYLGIKIAATGALFLVISLALMPIDKPRSWVMAVGVACFACGLAAVVVGLLLAIWL